MDFEIKKDKDSIVFGLIVSLLFSSFDSLLPLNLFKYNRNDY